jgi:hypothetical protein
MFEKRELKLALSKELNNGNITSEKQKRYKYYEHK